MVLLCQAGTHPVPALSTLRCTEGTELQHPQAGARPSWWLQQSPCLPSFQQRARDSMPKPCLRTSQSIFLLCL